MRAVVELLWSMDMGNTFVFSFCFLSLLLIIIKRHFFGHFRHFDRSVFTDVLFLNPVKQRKTQHGFVVRKMKQG